MAKKQLQLEQLNKKLNQFIPIKSIIPPQSGWIKAIRSTLGISLQQLGNKLNISKNSVRALEIREKEGSITIKTLREAANALDMELVYGFIPKDGTLEALIDRKARELAEKIVLKTSNTMKLEDQENSKERLKKAIEERFMKFKTEMPKILWD
jgi:predicted DNA-binding mobile mystery protein A